MPRFFLDSFDGTSVTRDGPGLELDNCEAARQEAIGILSDLARDVLPADNCRVYTVDVRSARGHVVYTASLCFVGRRLSGWDTSPEQDFGHDLTPDNDGRGSNT